MDENIEKENSESNTENVLSFGSERIKESYNTSNSQQKDDTINNQYNNNSEEVTEGNYRVNIENIIGSDESLVQKSPHFKGELINENRFQSFEERNQEVKSEENFVNYNIIGNNKIETPENLVMILKDAIDDSKKQYKLLRKEYIDEVKKKTEAQQLLQKCVEDLKLEISLSIKDIQNHSKYLINFN